MSFIKTWSPYFSSNVRMRGRAIQMDGQVDLQPPADGELARANVQGTNLYHIVIGDDEAKCTCPHFAEGTYCKHIWATLLELKHQPHFDEAMAQAAEDLDQAQPRLPKARKRSGESRRTRHREPAWAGTLAVLRMTGGREWTVPAGLPTALAHICYVVSPELSRRHRGPVVELHQREMTAKGWGRLKKLTITSESIAQLADPQDRELCAILRGGTWVSEYERGDDYVDERGRSAFRVPDGAWRGTLQRMIQTGRCYTDSDAQSPPLTWDDGKPWQLWLTGDVENKTLQVTVELRRGSERMAIGRPTLMLGGPDGLLVHHGYVAAFDDREAYRWVVQFREDMRARTGDSTIAVPLGEVDQFLDRLYLLENLPEIDLPEGIGRAPISIQPTPCIAIHGPVARARNEKLTADVWFEYEQLQVKPEQAGRFVSGANGEAPMQRDLRFEREAIGRLFGCGLRQLAGNGTDTFTLTPSLLPECAATLLAEGWRVTADQRAIHRPGPPRISVTSGIDWFELRGSVSFDTEQGAFEIDIPDILAAARSGRHLIELGDGSQGLLPEHWLNDHGLLAAIGRLEGDHLRFRHSQAALLDALLDQQELVSVDEKFAEARRRLSRFDGVESKEPAATFDGELRSYQRDALGWFDFLQWFGMGGILADDMGLGKTVQVLAMFDAWYGSAPPDRHRPSLVVAPRSVLFNWIDEAARFTPKLRVQAYTGVERESLRDAFHEHDVIVTTYGLLRRDAEQLVEHDFYYVILDEAQAIKNPNSQAAKASRLIRADHRLALTGTPVENHLGDLWSIFEFLNPGMLGSNTRFGQLVRTTSAQPRMSNAEESPEAQTAWQIAQALRPFILRRTKREVLDDLPEKTEQTLVCEMEGPQLKTYQDLRDHYRGTLLSQFGGDGAKPVWGGGDNGASGMMVLEALLRLRQAACHPGLIDPNRTAEPSAKLETLLDSLVELTDEGHKALVFSQFTSMLAIVRNRLDAMNIPYAYLDGKTRKRKPVVDQFQSDPDCPLFLISLKAGGLGLNLTAAEYVFILDPWWNPAVEQQAIDRAHRIGQTRHVFAYRLICQDTIEQRIADLQAKKQKLADAIVGGQKSLLRSLTRQDLEMLLS